ncbi:MAG: hypothetical protein U5L01_00910 [Rheinheimera sp.]|nr:hypothetical protein [Rheinheimera sp.]
MGRQKRAHPELLEQKSLRVYVVELVNLCSGFGRCGSGAASAANQVRL